MGKEVAVKEVIELGGVTVIFLGKVILIIR